MPSLSMIQSVAIWVLPVLLSITLHEAAHAWVADRCGDTTAKAMGRLSLNPFNHVDPVGTILVPLLIGLLSGFHFIFGWAKPVPVTWERLRNPRHDMVLVAVAGPLLNLILALVFAACIKLASISSHLSSNLIIFMLLTGQAGILINLVLAFINLIPILPLDGGRIVQGFLPKKFADQYVKSERFGLLIIFVLLLTGLIGQMIRYPMSWMLHFIRILFNI